jgi:hypothetical protein
VVFQEELQPERSLADARIALDEIQAPGRQAAAQDFVQPFDPR